MKQREQFGTPDLASSVCGRASGLSEAFSCVVRIEQVALRASIRRGPEVGQRFDTQELDRRRLIVSTVFPKITVSITL